MEKRSGEMMIERGFIEALRLSDFDVIVLAKGEFPKHQVPLSLLQRDIPIVCCDGAIGSLETFGKEAFALIGDGDSIPHSLLEKYKTKWHFVADQETNDLTKAVKFCKEKGFKRIAILGACGMREDHSLANISLLISYCKMLKCEKDSSVMMFSDYGVFIPIVETTTFASFPKQQVSIFSLESDKALTSRNLLYPIENRCFKYWWEGSLNEAENKNFTLETKGEVIVFQTYEAKS